MSISYKNLCRTASQQVISSIFLLISKRFQPGTWLIQVLDWKHTLWAPLCFRLLEKHHSTIYVIQRKWRVSVSIILITTLFMNITKFAWLLIFSQFFFVKNPLLAAVKIHWMKTNYSHNYLTYGIFHLKKLITSDYRHNRK